MNKERDLLPWILGTLLVAGAALAITAVSTKSSATSSRQPQAMAAAQGPVVACLAGGTLKLCTAHS